VSGIRYWVSGLAGIYVTPDARNLTPDTCKNQYT